MVIVSASILGLPIAFSQIAVISDGDRLSGKQRCLEFPARRNQ
jgi:hypothetical protein